MMFLLWILLKTTGDYLVFKKDKNKKVSLSLQPHPFVKPTFPGSLRSSSSVLGMWAEIYGEDEIQFHY